MKVIMKQENTKMKKIILIIMAASLVLMYLLILPTNILDIESTLSEGNQYSSIVPAKPPKVPPKE